MEAQVQNVTAFNPLAFAMLVLLAGLTWFLPRRLAVSPLLALTCLMPLGQEFVLFGLHFYLFRVLMLVGVLRIFAKGEAKRLRWTSMDRIFLYWVVVSIVFGTMAEPSMKLLTNRLGDAYNALTCYFFIRCVLVDFEDLVTSVRALAWLSLLVAAFMLTEKLTARNWFSVFGGVPELTGVREGHLRCQGAFRHPILAGTFGATQLPLFVALCFFKGEYRFIGIAGSIASLAIAFAASSSGALMALVSGMFGMPLWMWRFRMRLLRRATIAALMVLALVMQAPVWYLFDRLSSLTGGTGWHRAYLIDQAIGHFDEWWLFGTTYTAHWGPSGEVIPTDPNMMDITNQYIGQGVAGGMPRLLLFVAIIVVLFKSVGRFVANEAAEFRARLFVWALGVSLFGHCLSFMSVTYFDQSIVVWYWLLAAITGITCTVSENALRSESENAVVRQSTLPTTLAGLSHTLS